MYNELGIIRKALNYYDGALVTLKKWRLIRFSMKLFKTSNIIYNLEFKKLHITLHSRLYSRPGYVTFSLRKACGALFV